MTQLTSKNGISGVQSAPIHIPKPKPELYRKYTVPWAIAMVLSLLIGIDISSSYGFNLIAQALVFIPLGWVIFSIHTISNTEQASNKFLGTPVSNIPPGKGLMVIPAILFQVTKYTYKTQQEQFPGETDEVFKGHDDEPLPPNMVRPLRITTGAPVEGADETNPLAIQMTLIFLYYLRVRLIDPLKFEVSYGSWDEFWRQIQDTGDKLLNTTVAATPGVAALIENVNGLMERLEKVMEEMCKEGGLFLVESGISAPDLTQALATAVRDVGVIRAQVNAEQDKRRRLGYADADVDAKTIEKTSEALKNASGAAQVAYVGREVLSDKTTFLGLEGITQMYGLAENLSKLSSPRDTKKGGDL